MRFLFLAAALVLSLPALPQEKPKSKPAAKQAAHSKATPEQIQTVAKRLDGTCMKCHDTFK